MTGPTTAATRALVLDAVAAYPRREELGAESYETRGVFNSEMAAILAVSTTLGIDMIVESGRARGQSTRILAKYLASTGVALHSFERARNADTEHADRQLAGAPNTTLHYGDARIAIPTLLAGTTAKRIAVLIDGPKGRKALDLLDAARAANPAVVVGFVHDLSRREDGHPNYARHAAEADYAGAFFTDDEAYVAATRHLDANISVVNDGTTWEPYRMGGLDIGSYGPTVGVFPFEGVTAPSGLARRLTALRRAAGQLVVERLGN
jgi:hypothetical protein